MASVTLRGNAVSLVGEPPKPAAPAPTFTLVADDLSELTGESLKGTRVVLNIFPSIDTPTCAKSVKRFNELAAGMTNTVVVCVSADLPFAQKRFCGAEGIANVRNASSFRTDFGRAFGLTIAEGVLKGLLARAVVVLDERGVVRHTQLVPEIANEPDYDAALAALK